MECRNLCVVFFKSFFFLKKMRIQKGDLNNSHFGSSHLHPNFIHCTALLIRMALALLSGSSFSDVDMRTSAKRGFLGVETDPGVLSSLIEQLNKTAETE